MKKLLPVLLVVFGLIGGATAGWFMRPATEAAVPEEPDDQSQTDNEPDAGDYGGGYDEDPSGEMDYVKLNNQFIVPVVNDGDVSALVVMSLSLEVKMGEREAVYTKEPKIRDALLSVLFQHANAGGFNGTFTATRNLDVLRNMLTEATRQAMESDLVANVLIIDIVRQDLS